jgi:transposase-like protein
MVDVFLSERRDAAAAMTCFEQAVREPGIHPTIVSTDRAACSPPALERVLPEAEHLRGKMVQQGIARDHGHLKSRRRSMRWFKTDQAASLFCRAQGFIRTLQAGFYAWG